MSDSEYLTVDHLSLKVIKRIFKRIRVNPITQCWEWLGHSVVGGYGQIEYNNHNELVHRVLYAWAVGPVPRRQKGQSTPNLDHVVCDNPPCCNPAHVDLVPAKVNTLRGCGPTAINARKTHCKYGHLLPTEPNRSRNERRVCKVCHNQRGHQKRFGPNRQEFLEKVQQKQRQRRAAEKLCVV